MRLNNAHCRFALPPAVSGVGTYYIEAVEIG